MENLQVSNILTALREMELEQRESTIQSKMHLLASAPAADDYSALTEFTAPTALQVENREQQTIAQKPQAGHEALILFANDYSALAERVVRVIETAERERQASLAAERRAVHAETEITRQALRMDRLERKMRDLQDESDRWRQYVEQMIALLDSLQPSKVQ
jgi:hypothetical protein